MTMDDERKVIAPYAAQRSSIRKFATEYQRDVGTPIPTWLIGLLDALDAAEARAEASDRWFQRYSDCEDRVTDLTAERDRLREEIAELRSGSGTRALPIRKRGEPPRNMIAALCDEVRRSRGGDEGGDDGR